MPHPRYLLPALFLALMLTACGAQKPASNGAEVMGGGRQRVQLVSPTGQKVEILAEIANDPVAQNKGLQGREALGPLEGMLFVFTDDRVRSFWMKGTLIPLDIIFFDADGGFVASHAMEPCTTPSPAPCPAYSSQFPARYALEVQGGFVQKHGITNVWELGEPVQFLP